MVIDNVDHILGVFRLLFAVSEMRQLSIIVCVMECMFTVQADVFVFHNDISAVDEGLVFVCVFHHGFVGRIMCHRRMMSCAQQLFDPRL